MKKLLLILILLFTPIYPSYAQNVSDIIGNTEKSTTSTIEEEVLLEDGDIKLKMPSQTDNPSYVITFIDPSEKKEGVQLEIDEDRYVEIESPYTLPALGIGVHILKFKYVDDEGATQTLERQLIILPRPPILNSPSINGTSVTLSGTGLAGAELLLTISSGAKTFQDNIHISDSGTWTYTFDTGIQNAIFSVQAITRKYGYASDFSEALTFEIGTVNTSKEKEENILSFSFEQLNSETLKTLTSSNLDFLILIISILIVGVIIGTGLNNIFKKKKEKKVISNFREKIKTDEKKEITLRELFEKDSNKPKKEEEEKEDKKNTKEREEDNKEKDEKKEDVIISKNEFLKVYKNFDPDNEKGEEKRKFKISLTSKK